MKVNEESEKVGLKLNVQKTKVMTSGAITSGQIDGGNNGNSDRLYFLGLQNHCRWWLHSRNEKMLAPWKKSYDEPRQHTKKQRHYFADQVHLVKAMIFPAGMYGCESWTIKKVECWRIDAFELWCWRRLLSPLDSKEIKPVSPNGNQPWILIGRTDAEAPVRRTPDAKN